ncbi:MAG TPA: peptide deformylase [Verrucomicrobiales bacterium]|nr:peptide deformylase [Verrucomicrobiales bacterium]HAH99417.1 peptide deformylase [Verrucomicrobiales bacterium]|tara:strand:- start:2177 stop:2752 length:576 start_codon:yes stop_codon:yes gene_type:complete
MILDIVKYGNPVLRQKGECVEEVTSEISQLIDNMLETMHEARGIGLAAQQVGRPLQLAIIDVTGVEDRPSRMSLDGEPVNPEDYMPLILINPEWIAASDVKEDGGEGCLSFPDVYGEINRPEEIDVTATDENGEQVAFRCGGLLARAIQHEWDHLQGILFIDRMDAIVRTQLKPEVDAIQIETKNSLDNQR